MADALLAVLILTPVVLAYLLKSNAAVAFLALCGGFAVITLSGSDIEHLFGKTKITSLTSNDIDLILLVLPLLLTLLLTFKAVTAKGQRLFHAVPALCAGALLAIVAGPMFSQALSTNFSNSQAWRDLQDIQSYVVGAGLLFSLLLIWSGNFLSSHPHKKHK
ncbi:MAG: hypothetical protein ACREGG_02285 [Candidatus Saccharimonadales bacterium]